MHIIASIDISVFVNTTNCIVHWYGKPFSSLINMQLHVSNNSTYDQIKILTSKEHSSGILDVYKYIFQLHVQIKY